ncbi:Ty1/Copia family ribonuclease HI, partial [Mycobacterium kansasii]
KRFLNELSLKQKHHVVYCDNQSVIHLSEISSQYSKSKHIQIRYHWIRDTLEQKVLQLEKVDTDDNGSDMMTKALLKGKFEVCRNLARLKKVNPSWVKKGEI